MAARSMMAPLKANPPRCPRGAPGAARSGRKAFRIAREGMNMMRVEGRSAAGGVACSATAAGGSALSPEEMARFADIIRKPILTETTTKAIEDNKYYFEVAKGCTKNEIKKAIESLFDVKVLQVNTQNPPIKRKMNRQRPGKQLIVRRPKRAVVTLVEGDAIPLFEEEEEGEEDGGESQE